MYCKNCGNPVPDGQNVCPACGCVRNTGSRFCAHCGQSIEFGEKTCPHCGTRLATPVPVKNSQQLPSVQGKSKLVAGLLAIFLGALGIHNFYLNNIGKGIAQLLITVLTCGIFGFISGIWSLIEGILILCGRITVDGNGNPLTD